MLHNLVILSVVGPMPVQCRSGVDLGPISQNLSSVTNDNFCYKLLKSLLLIGYQQICHWSLSFVIKKRLCETGPWCQSRQCDWDIKVNVVPAHGYCIWFPGAVNKWHNSCIMYLGRPKLFCPIHYWSHLGVWCICSLYWVSNSIRA